MSQDYKQEILPLNDGPVTMEELEKEYANIYPSVNLNCDDDKFELINAEYQYTFDIESKYCKNVMKYIQHIGMSEELKKRVLSEINVHLIAYLENPSEDLVKFALSKWIGVYKTLVQYKIPVKEEWLKPIIENDSAAFFYIDDASEELQMYGVTHNPKSFGYIKNPSYKVVKYAVEQDPNNIWEDNIVGVEYFDELLEMAIRKNPKIIKNMRRSFDEKWLKLAVSLDGKCIQYIPNASEELQETAVVQNGLALHHIFQPSEKVKRLAVQQNGFAIRALLNKSQKKGVSRELKELAIEQNPEVIQLEGIRSKNLEKKAIRMDHLVVNLYTAEPQMQKYAERFKLAEICLGLQTLELPALLTLLIYDEYKGYHFYRTAMNDHDKWQVIVAVKHHKF